MAFDKVDAPLKLVGVPHLVETIERVLCKWPNRLTSTATETPPFFTISSSERPDRYLCEDHVGGTEPRQLDRVNAVCDMVAALPRALTDCDDTLICLHAAAAAINGRLVVFPNIRRSGKSTLTAALAFAGHTVFNDDVLPICFDRHGRAFGLATGISPRLRLPLPDKLAEDFQAWTKAASSTENKQYSYLNLADQAKFGEVLPIGGLVILDRQEGQTSILLEEVGADVAMDVLLYQNFTRDRHSADVLKSIAGLLSSQPTFRLTFSDLAGAVRCLEATFDVHSSDVTAVEPMPFRPFRMANLDVSPNRVAVSSDTVRQREGAFEQLIGATLYLADADGRSIHRMDALSSAIWEMFKEPIRAPELEQTLAEGFPDVPRERIAHDVTSLLKKLAKAGLLENGQ